ncbi:MAG: ATP synthase F1 subunit delta [Myxococcota bacterium]|jgi:F-type H+-transporting ATPase subunit delta|nr:ATP synthase F1 subunit delta [Myxococcota bacterium]
MLQSDLVAQRYATALLDIAAELQKIDSIGKELSDFCGLFRGSLELSTVLANPALPMSERKRAQDALLARLGYHPMLSNFLRLLVDRGRIRLLPRIDEAYRRACDRRAGRVRGVLRSAAPLSAQHFERLSKALSRRLGREVILEQRLDPELLAGFHVQVEGLMFDGSLRGQLGRLEEQLLSRTAAGVRTESE